MNSKPGLSTNQRGSAGAIAKRRAARRFNAVVLGERPAPGRDGRTEKRRLRLLKELAEGSAGKGGKILKPIDVLLRVQALLELGESLSSIRKIRRLPKPVAMSDDLVAGVRELHRAYGFSVQVYAFVGLADEVLRAAGVVATDRKPGPRRAAPKGSRPGLRRHEGARTGRRAGEGDSRKTGTT